MIALGVILLISGAIALGNENFQGRIVGGYDVDIKDFPYQISLVYYLSHRCGGVILNKYWGLTAGHCIEGAWPYELVFRSGSNDVGTGGTFHGVESIHIHPKYNDSYLDYDFALIKVRDDKYYKPFNFSNPLSQPIDLADTEQETGKMLTISGWGSEWDGGEASKKLKAVDLPMIDRKICRDKYNIYAPELPDMITDRMICAGFEEGGKDACQGDSGGPMVDKSTGKLQGLVSWAFGCAYPHVPGIYANIANSEIKKWIQETMETN